MDNRSLWLIAPSQFWTRNYLQYHPDMIAADRDRLFVNSEGVGLIKIRGVMDKFEGWNTSYLGSVVRARQAVLSALNDKDVSALMLVLDTPGGSVDGLSELGDAVYKARQSKMVVAQVDGMAASAGYYVASQADKIYAHRMDMVGSIGTRMMLYDFHKMFEKEGVEAVPIDTGKFKSAGAEGTEITKEQRADFQRIVDTYYQDFLNMISRGREMDVKNVKPLADGRVFIGQEAVDNGLIDGLQTFEETYAQIRQAVVESQGTPRRDRASRKIRLAAVS